MPRLRRAGPRATIGDQSAREGAMRVAYAGTRGASARGFTLIEQVMVVVIVAVLAGVAVPPLRALMTRSRLRSAQMTYIGALRFARYTAAIRSTRTVFCPSLDGAHCSGGTHWSQGWLVGLDRNHDNQPDGRPLRVGRAYDHLAIRSSVARRRVSFHPDRQRRRQQPDPGDVQQRPGPAGTERGGLQCRPRAWRAGHAGASGPVQRPDPACPSLKMKKPCIAARLFRRWRPKLDSNQRPPD